MRIFLAGFCLQPSTLHRNISGSWLLALFFYILALILRREVFVPYFEGMPDRIFPLLCCAPAERFQFKHERLHRFSAPKPPSLSFPSDCHPLPTHSPCIVGTASTSIHVHPLLVLPVLHWKRPSATAGIGKVCRTATRTEMHPGCQREKLGEMVRHNWREGRPPTPSTSDR